MKRIAISLLAVALGCAAALPAQPCYGAPAEEMAPSDKQLNKLYWEGQEALKDSDWDEALQRFKDLEREQRSKEPKNVDTALYWQAYALTQAKRTAEAKAVADRLHREFPQSRWGKEVDTLTRPTVTVNPGSTSILGDEELAATAIEGLMNAPPERAVPLLRKVMQGSHSTKVKKRALFVLSQFGTKESLDIVVETARSNSDPELREEAIQMLGVSGEKAAVERLKEIYAQSKDPREQRKVIQAWLVAGREDLVLGAAQSAPSEEVRREAIQVLGAMGAGKELKKMFDSSTDPKTRRAVIQALGVAGDTASIAAIADSNADEETRRAAMQALGIAGDSETLVRLYPKATSAELRESILQGLLITGDSKAVLGLYRVAKSTDEKKHILRTLTVMDGGAAVDLIEAELGGE